ncbi:hypothetical protein [Aequorivita viscosa]|nr:hypothetical protein [Aequorivita viscosa]
MKTLHKGEISFSENYKSWLVKTYVSWNKTYIKISLDSRKLDLETDFPNCSLTKGNFLTFLSRSNTYSFSGNKSKYSELLLESIEVQHLMRSGNPVIKLEHKSIIFKGLLRKKDFLSLSNVFKLFTMVIDKIEREQRIGVT